MARIVASQTLFHDPSDLIAHSLRLKHEHNERIPVLPVGIGIRIQILLRQPIQTTHSWECNRSLELIHRQMRESRTACGRQHKTAGNSEFRLKWTSRDLLGEDVVSRGKDISL